MIGKIKIFTKLPSTEPHKLKNLNPILSFHWNNLEGKEILSGAENPLSPLKITSSPAEADWFILPMHWTYYLWNEKANLGEAEEMAKLAQVHKKHLIVWFNGDLVPVIPFENAIVFLPGMIKSKAKENQRACPVFVPDPLSIVSPPEDLYRLKSDKPNVGFCGYAENSLLKIVWHLIRGVQLKLLCKFKHNNYQEIPLIPPTISRSRIVKTLLQNSEMAADFILRDKYLGDYRNKERVKNSNDVVNDYFTNIYNNDYTLCIRGFGNWSYRFYDTLACGRIPVFIDTDCVLPLSSTIDWKKYCVWVDYSELHLLGEKILDFHSSLSENDFIDRQIACRKLWKERFRIESFMNHIQEYLSDFT